MPASVIITSHVTEVFIKVSIQLFTVYDRIHKRTYHIAVTEQEGVNPSKEARSCLAASEEITKWQTMTDDEYRDWKKSL